MTEDIYISPPRHSLVLFYFLFLIILAHILFHWNYSMDCLHCHCSVISSLTCCLPWGRDSDLLVPEYSSDSIDSIHGHSDIVSFPFSELSTSACESMGPFTALPRDGILVIVDVGCLLACFQSAWSLLWLQLPLPVYFSQQEGLST